MPRLEYRDKGTPDRNGVTPLTGRRVTLPGRPPCIAFFEAELRGNLVLFASGGTDRVTKRRETRFDSEDEAYSAYAQALAAKFRRGYERAGSPLEIEGASAEPQGSLLLIDVYFSAADERFLEEVLRCDSHKKLATLAQPWFEDQRPFARRMLLAYVDDGCDRPGHKALVKRIFKLAERAKDQELLTHFMVAFDRFNRHVLVTVGYRWDPDTRSAKRDVALRGDPLAPESLKKGTESPQFSRATRRYLARRVFRYFRRLGYRDPVAYRKALLPALMRYREEDLSSVGRLLGAWSLIHVLYGASHVLTRDPKGVRIAKGRALTELSPAPQFPAAWEGAVDDLFQLLRDAGSRTVRGWALALLREGARAILSDLSILEIKTLLLTNNDEAQSLGVELFSQRSKLDALRLEDWFDLLGTANLEVLAVVCERAANTVNPTDLTLGQCVELSLSSAAPLARLAFAWVKAKSVSTEAQLLLALRTCRAKVATVRQDAAIYCGELLRSLPFVRSEQARDLCDAAHREVRGEGLAIASSRFPEDFALWSALCESPYPDVRSFVVKRANHFRAGSTDSLGHVFGTVLLSLQGSARDKRRVAQEIAERIEVQPERASAFLPLLGTVLRSVHPAERKLALSTLARVAVRDAKVRQLALERFPEFALTGLVSQ